MSSNVIAFSSSTHIQVLWYREERVIVPSDTRILESSSNKHTLILRNVEESDFGLYSCTAENLLGRSSQNIELSGIVDTSITITHPIPFCFWIRYYMQMIWISSMQSMQHC